MRDEEQRRVITRLRVALAPIVQGGYNRLSGAGRRHEQISMTSMQGPLYVQGFEHFLLVGVGPNFES